MPDATTASSFPGERALLWGQGWKRLRGVLEAIMPPVSPAILVVDNESSLCDLLQELLELPGYTVALATDGATALARLTAG